MDFLLNLSPESVSWQQERVNRMMAEPPKHSQEYFDRIKDQEIMTNSILAMAGLASDWGQTRNLTSDGHYEQNPLLGKYPNRDAVNGYFGAMMILHALANKKADKNDSNTLNKLLTIVQGLALTNNNKLGISSNF